MWKSVLLILTVAITAKLVLDYYKNINEEMVSAKSDQKVFTKEELLQTTNGGQLYLAILGNVYDVTKGDKHYGKDGSYRFFVGVDGSRAFSTGKFQEDLTDQIDDLSESQIGDIFNWRDFFETTYKYVGRLNGLFYDQNGEPTEYLKKCEEIYSRHQKKENQNFEFHTRFPTCNSEWSQDRGGLVRVWCSKQSGGVERDWVGYPRLVSNPHSKTEQCCCVNDEDLNHPSVKKYEKCDPKAIQCNFL